MYAAMEPRPRSSGAPATTTAAIIAQAKASSSTAPPAAPCRDVMNISSDDDLLVGDPFLMAFGAPPPQEEPTVPWRGPEQHFIGDRPTQLETTQQAATAEQHVAALDAINRGYVNPGGAASGEGEERPAPEPAHR